ncbi:hypothetical protein L484_019278 [Morus notabilis]|uniref:Uncharacterized protein n=1 Tax=Morus notabilis TaxID=981085 RepID=W9S2B1_9ROSA|nr:uncharacterized protein LOC21402224 [Morus notabilis]EXC05030.1 hypothetical protein L484_019278 [Morus notabilis]
MINIFPFGLACEDDSDEDYKENKSVSCIDENKRSEAEQRISSTSGVIMDFDQQQQQQENINGVEVEVDFEIWPVEHPMEPPDEDRPVKCPMPESSVINDEGSKREKRLAESLTKRAEESAANKQGKEDSGAVAERPVRAVRKRHHTLTGEGGDDHDVIVPALTRMPPLPSDKNLTIFQVLHE